MDHASIDIKKLADSFRGKTENLHPLSEKCCIYGVPEPKRSLNPYDFDPHIVSIGPIHHGKKELEAIEEHKMRYLQHFLQRTEVRIEYFLALIKDREEQLRSCYGEIIDLESEDFISMILVDAIFLIEYFLRGFKGYFITNDDRILGKPWIDVRRDLWLSENQLPLFILDELFNLAKSETHGYHYKGLSLITITMWFRKNVLDFVRIEEGLLEIHFSEAEHFLGLVRLCLQPSQLSTQTEFKAQNITCATELHQAGVKFKLGSTKNLLDITLDKGILEIPFLSVYDNTKRFYRNLLVFEKMHCNTHYLNDYIIIMSYLVNSAKDAELLIQNGIIARGDGEMLSNFFQSLVKDSVLVPTKFQYSDLMKDLKAYCRSPWRKWKAILKQKYFTTPWASISVIAAVVLIVLTFIQSVCSIIAL